MKIAVLADIHSNLEALEAVLQDVGKVEEIWCLGDVVGYGPEPNRCGEIIEKRIKHCVLGNHDAGLLGRLEISWFNAWAAEAIEITQKILDEKSKRFLENLPEIQKLGEIILVHGSVRTPLTEYIFEIHQAKVSFENFSEKFCFCGHTHCPAVFGEEAGIARRIILKAGEKIKLEKNGRYIINPGSVGQPRDGDWRASYGLFDEEKLTFELRRVEYDLEKTQEKMKKLGLPEFLIQRLSLGR